MTRPAAASLSLEPIAPRESRDVDSLKPGASMCLPAYRVWRWFIVPGLALWLSSGGAEALTAYHVGPTASGLGDGSSVDNAAQYADAAFWSMVETVLETDEVTVRFAASSDYGSNTNTRPALSFRNFGNP